MATYTCHRCGKEMWSLAEVVQSWDDIFCRSCYGSRFDSEPRPTIAPSVVSALALPPRQKIERGSMGGSRPTHSDVDRLKLKIFICHSSEDKGHARDLAGSLRGDGFDPWLDEERLLPGQEWALEIGKAVKSAHVVTVCISAGSTTKTGFIQKEIRLVLDAADERPDGSIFVIPVRFEECEMPERLQRWQRVDLFDEGGYYKLIQTLIAKRSELG